LEFREEEALAPGFLGGERQTRGPGVGAPKFNLDEALCGLAFLRLLLG
jgi:hypothetical protein